MKAVERDRFLIGFLFAMIIHVLIVLLLGFVDLGADASLQRTLPPVTVRLEAPKMPELSEMLPDLLRDQPPEEIPEPETPEAPVEDLPAEQVPLEESSPATRPGTEARQDTTTGSRIAASSGSTAAPGVPFEIPQPSEAAMKRAEMEIEQGPRTPRSSSSESAGSRSFTGTENRPVGSPRTGNQFGDNRIIAIEKTDNPWDSGDTAATSDAGSTGTQTESGRESVVSENLLGELENIGSASGQGTAGSDANDRQTERDTKFSDTPQKITSDSGDVEIFLEEGHQTRHLLGDPPLPVLTEEQLSQLPDRIEVTVTITLEADGVLSSTGILKSSGSPEIDKEILAAVRRWKFTRVDGAEPVEGQATIVIRAR